MLGTNRKLTKLKGNATLVVDAKNADVISTIVVLKKEIEAETGKNLKITITGAEEAHILAKELAEANIGVVLVPSRPFPKSWEKRRMYVVLMFELSYH